ncbi:MAG: cyclic nucleotide-binding domain-containing protein [Treponema sp.]|nr:cyclic nucleotide-binding domain-containing protein [Treponema sp.]
MKKILTASTNPVVISTVESACKTYAAYFSAEVFGATEPVIAYINYEIPEIKVLDYTSQEIRCDEILDVIKGDAWLHYGGIIAVCANSRQVETLEELKDNNMIAIVTVQNFKTHFSRILRILWQNQQFLFNRGMQDIIGGQETGSFTCGNDPMDIRFYVNFLVSYLYNTNRISGDDRFKLQMTLMEFLTNALEHGNLGITYEDKTRWLSSGRDILNLIASRNADPKYRERRIHISYSIGKSKSYFKIRDDGDGFDWRKFIEKNGAEDEGEKFHGRGISLGMDLVQRVSYNEKGNEVSFELPTIRNKVNTVPGIMEPFATIDFKNKDVICRENEMSNDLFFIVSGRYAVYAGKKLAAVLTPNDMFIGEMAFLLNDRRTATVLAVGDCRLIKIPKTAFLTLIRKNPHYGIFLSKMLALRLQRQTKALVEAQKKLAEFENLNGEII